MAVRVSYIPGRATGYDKTVLLVAPHAADDARTAIIVERAAKDLNCAAIINYGFQSSKCVDVDKDLADCNKCSHVKEPVVFDEFLMPIYKVVSKAMDRYNKLHPWFHTPVDPTACLIFYVLGCSDEVNVKANERVECVVGWGQGQKKDSPSCKMWRKNLFVDKYRNKMDMLKAMLFPTKFGEVVEGCGFGRYSGRGTEEMNQFFRKHQSNPFVDSMQICYPEWVRETDQLACAMGITLAEIVSKMAGVVSYDQTPCLKTV